MSAEKVLELIAKGFTLIETIRQVSESASPALKAMYELIEKQRSGAEVTDEELEAVEKLLDEQLGSFNEPLPDEDDNS